MHMQGWEGRGVGAGIGIGALFSWTLSNFFGAEGQSIRIPYP